MARSIQSNSHTQSGVTIAELLVVIVVIGVIVAFALLQQGGANKQLKRQNVAQELKVAFERARFDSVKRRADNSSVQAKVVVDVNSYVLTTYIYDEGAVTARDNSIDLSGQDIVIVDYNAAALPFTVFFNQRGEAVNNTGFSISPVFRVCNLSCGSPTAANSNIVLVTATGTANLLGGASAVPVFSNANVSSVNTASGIKNTVSLP